MKGRRSNIASPVNMDILALGNLKHVHGTSLDADAAGNALGGGRHLRLINQNAERTCSLTLATAHTELLIDHVHTGLGILRDSTLFAGSGAFTALHTGHGANFSGALNNLNAGLIRMELLMKCHRASADALQTGHTGASLFYH